MNTVRRLVSAAGGNETAIEVIGKPLSRKDYVSRGAELFDDFE